MRRRFYLMPALVAFGMIALLETAYADNCFGHTCVTGASSGVFRPLLATAALTSISDALLSTSTDAIKARVADIADRIQQLTAAVGQKAQVPASPGDNNSSSCYFFERNLSLGAHGDDVLALQSFLNTHGSMVAFTGPGSVGAETIYFGPLTNTALIKYQAEHAISPAIGYFGPTTRTAICGGMRCLVHSSSSYHNGIRFHTGRLAHADIPVPWLIAVNGHVLSDHGQYTSRDFFDRHEHFRDDGYHYLDNGRSGEW
jgi:hypothetical protein